MKTSLVDQSLRAVHPGGVEKCCIFCPEKKKSKMTPHGMAELTTKIWRENEIQTGELNIRSDN